MKKMQWFSLLLSMVLVFGVMVSCGSGYTPAVGVDPPPSSKANGQWTVGMVIPGPDAYYQMGVEGLKYIIEKKNDNRFIVLNSENTEQKELANVENLIAQGVDAIVLMSLNNEISQQACQAANAAGIPFFTQDSDAAPGPGKVQGAVSKDDLWIGQVIGKWAWENYEGKKFGMISGLQGMQAIKNMEIGFTEEATKDGRNEFLQMIPADFDPQRAMKAMQDLLQAHPGLDMVYVINDEMGVGALQAIKDSGRDVVMLTSNGSPLGIQMILDGDMPATSAWSPTENGMTMGQMVIDYLLGKPIEEYVLQKIDMITIDNIDEVNPWGIDEMISRWEQKHGGN